MRAAAGPLPTRTTNDPIRAYKLAYPVVVGGRIVWHALVMATTYETEAVATCPILEPPLGGSSAMRMRRLMFPLGLMTEEEHGPVPSQKCTCGFYAVKAEQRRRPVQRRIVSNWNRRRKNRDRPKLDPLPGYALLEVDLLGKVIVFARGYRAERQRVMKARLDGRCVMCGKRAKGCYAGTFIVGPRAQAALVSTCGCQIPVLWDLQDVRNMAGTEVEWDSVRQPLLTTFRRNA